MIRWSSAIWLTIRSSPVFASSCFRDFCDGRKRPATCVRTLDEIDRTVKFSTDLDAHDRALAVENLKEFLPEEIFDIHAHVFNAKHFPEGTMPFLADAGVLGCDRHRAALARYMPVSKIHGLYFGVPHKQADRGAINNWLKETLDREGTALTRGLMLVSPDDSDRSVADALSGRQFCGIKVYHCYAPRPDTMQASIAEYAPEWMWEILHQYKGVMMLHVVRNEAMADEDNQKELRRLSRKYPGARIILAHIGRSFNYRHGRKGLASLSDLDNVYLDTSAICEAEAFRAALKHLGPRRILWGSDFPISEMRGRCVTTGSGFFWLHPEVIREGHNPPTRDGMTLVGLESLTSLREACDDDGLTLTDINDLFFDNAVRLLSDHLPATATTKPADGAALWTHARSVIASGTGLLSKHAEMFHSGWPAYYSRCSGSYVWDAQGRRYTDFAGGVGAILLGYNDDDVNRAVERRIRLGTYSTLVSPDEIRLAEELLSLHPWAAKVRYARGGGEAMAVAVRIARAQTGRSTVLFCGYHGWHDWYLAANLAEDTALDGHLLPGLLPRGVPRELKGTSIPFRYNDRASFDQAFEHAGGKLAAVVMEPMRSQFPKDDFLDYVAGRCRQAGGVFVIDEITSGLRHGFPGAHNRLGIQPDIAVYAKAISNGFPFAAIVGKKEVMDAGERSFISSSYWTDGVGPAAALAVLEKMQRLNVHDELWERGGKFQAALREVAARFPDLGLQVGGMPVSPSLAFARHPRYGNLMPLLVREMQERGYLVNTTLYLMYGHHPSHISGFMESFEAALSALKERVATESIEEQPDSPGQDRGFARLA